MESWSNLCRCCLSPDTTVSILDNNENVKEKFLETTSIEVREDDRLPQRLCDCCFTIMKSAHEFREQCLKMDTELKTQLDTIPVDIKDELLSQIERHMNSNQNMTEEDKAKESMKKLESIIKTEPMDDDDYYYVLVIDDPKDQDDKNDKKPLSPPHPIKKEIEHEDVNICINEDSNSQNADTNEFVIQNDSLQSCIDSFLISNTKVSASVPETILENEEGHENEVDFVNALDIVDSNEDQLITIDNANNKDNPITVTLADGVKEFNSRNLIKIVTPSGLEKTILLKNDEGVKYLTTTQEESNDNDDNMSQEEIILCEGDDNSQFQILKVDGSEFVIEYTDEGQIATVLQQEDGTFLCDCGEQFEDLAEFEKHQYKHNPAGEHLCNLCGKGFETAEILTGHTLLHRSTGPVVSCPFCNQVVRRNGLTQHIKYTHNTKPQCELCQKTFANQNNLKRHMIIHSGIKEFVCDICSKRFNQKITMQTHRLTHINSTTCNLCDTVFEDKAALTLHKESDECTRSKIHLVKEELMKTVRQEVTTNLGKLLGYACSICKKMFSLESALDHHIEKTHIIEKLEDKKGNKQMKRFECTICGKRCASQAMLIMHERVHTNERPFPCQLCSLRFKTKTHLRTHQLTHTREKKFGCSVCMKFFALKGNLVVHLRTHTGERPYVCTICGEAFIDSKYLKKHKLRKHSIDNMPWNKY
ncbi:zinc finger protein 836-like [Zerene cesonia]|uniref:zinc finger protein 836-like n=1 Tax=Zerene cesonia TaxID=33412 RepID=UPI0018E5474A|nr:zinc finger protein 836-like [Zerene cesonia]